MRKNPPFSCRFGQTSLHSSLLSRSSLTSEDSHPKPPKKPISLSEFLDRKIGKSSTKSLQEKPVTFSSIGSAHMKDVGNTRDEAGADASSNASAGSILDETIFRKLDSSVKEGSTPVGSIDESRGIQLGLVGDTGDSRKRKDPFGVSSGFSGNDERPGPPKSLVILGDDPKPRPKRTRTMKRGRKSADTRLKPFYNHYKNGCGWWDDDREGIDSEEVGCKESWEGMGSTTLGGLEWN